MATVFQCRCKNQLCSQAPLHQHPSSSSESCSPGQPSGSQAVERLIRLVTTNLSSVNHLGNLRRFRKGDLSIFVLSLCLSFCHKTGAGGVGTQGHSCPGSGSVLAPGLSWLLVWVVIHLRGKRTYRRARLPKGLKAISKILLKLKRIASQHPSIFSAFWNTIIKTQNTDIGSPLIIHFFPHPFQLAAVYSVMLDIPVVPIRVFSCYSGNNGYICHFK